MTGIRLTGGTVEDDSLEEAYEDDYDPDSVGYEDETVVVGDSEMEPLKDDRDIWDDLDWEDDPDDDYFCEYCEYDDEHHF